jgi:hypothetical protein
MYRAHPLNMCEAANARTTEVALGISQVRHRERVAHCGNSSNRDGKNKVHGGCSPMTGWMRQTVTAKEHHPYVRG